MNKDQKNKEQQIRILKFDCEMRAKAAEVAMSLPTSKNVKSLLENSRKISNYIFNINQLPSKEK